MESNKYERLRENVLTNTDDTKNGFIYCLDSKSSWIDEFNNKTNNPWPWTGDLFSTGSGHAIGDRKPTIANNNRIFIQVGRELPSVPVYKCVLKRFWNQ